MIENIMPYTVNKQKKNLPSASVVESRTIHRQRITTAIPITMLISKWQNPMIKILATDMESETK